MHGLAGRFGPTVANAGAGREWTGGATTRRGGSACGSRPKAHTGDARGALGDLAGWRRGLAATLRDIATACAA